MTTTNTRALTEKVVDFGQFEKSRAAGRTPFTPLQLEHVYVKLDFKQQFESARTSEDAKKFLRAVARAGMAAHAISDRYQGRLLEVQGSTLHIGLPQRPETWETTENATAKAFVADLHRAYRAIFDDSKLPVDGWRMTVDAGKTLVVAGRGVHNDDSLVSLGRSANRPAKYLYSQLERPEPHRDLKRFHVGIRDSKTGKWNNQNLDDMHSRLDEAKSIAAAIRNADPQLRYVNAASNWQMVNAQAVPIGAPGTPASPTAESPTTYFGWVMRTDLDGFTARVDECFDNNEELQELAIQFYGIMDGAAGFVAKHKQELAQLPWAGDNFTAAAVFATNAAYEKEIPKRLVELSLDFEKEMAETAVECGFDGWAHGVAGGEVTGNRGNVYLAGVEVSGRRFLVGAGEGFGKSTQAFGDIDPKAEEMVVYEPDWTRLHEPYKKQFKPADTYRGERSAIYRKASMEDLLRVRAHEAAAVTTTRITSPSGRPQPVPIRPYSP